MRSLSAGVRRVVVVVAVLMLVFSLALVTLTVLPLARASAQLVQLRAAQSPSQVTQTSISLETSVPSVGTAVPTIVTTSVSEPTPSATAAPAQVPTDTPAPQSDTPVPLDTPEPATDTPIAPPPTDIPAPPTNTPVVTGATLPPTDEVPTQPPLNTAVLPTVSPVASPPTTTDVPSPAATQTPISESPTATTTLSPTATLTPTNTPTQTLALAQPEQRNAGLPLIAARFVLFDELPLQDRPALVMHAPAPQAPAAPEQRQAEIDYPRQLRLGQSDVIQLRLHVLPTPHSGGSTAVVVQTQQPGHSVETKVLQVPLPYDLYDITLHAQLTVASSSLEIISADGTAQDISMEAGQDAVAQWLVQPKEAGAQKAIVAMQLRYTPKQASGAQIAPAVINLEPFTIEIVTVLGLSAQTARVVSLATSMLSIGSIVGVLDLVDRLRKLRRPAVQPPEEKPAPRRPRRR